MARQMIISPSMVCADLSQLGKQVQLLDEAGVDMFHWDIMDGVFVHNFCLTPDVIAACRPFSKRPFDVHVCITDPASFISEIAVAGADIISLQFETTPHIFRAIENIKKLGKKAGIVVNPITPVSLFEVLLGEIDMITIMTVDVGFAGQNFIYPMLEKIKQVRRIISEKDLHVDIQVDGNINDKTYEDVIMAGANVLVVGTSGLFTVDEDLKKGVEHINQKVKAIVDML